MTRDVHQGRLIQYNDPTNPHPDNTDIKRGRTWSCWTVTHSYRSVYEHLASGAQHLCGDVASKPLDHKAAAQLDEGSNVAPQEPEIELDEYEELSRIRDDIDELLGESPRISDINADSERDDASLQH